MPSNPLEDALSGMDPIDAATLFAGLRSSVPLGMLFRSGELNANEDAELAKRRPMAATMTEPRPRTYEDEQRDFEAMFPDPAIRRAVLTELINQRTQPYHPATATRRKDYEKAPEGTRHEARPLLKKADGGMITDDHTQPDMADGGRLLADPHLYATGGTVQNFNKGGKAAKTLDEMAAEMMKKGVKTADKPDLARRSLFGLGSQPAFPLANLDTKALQKMQSELKDAPAITEKSVTVDPGKGGVSETIRSVAATPMSRRSVLQSTAGQVLKGALPRGMIPDVGDVAKVAEAVAPASADVLIPSLMARALKMGLSEEQAIRFVEQNLPKGAKGADKIDTGTMHYLLESPYEFASNPSFEGASRLEVMRDILQQPTQGSPFQLRGALRGVQRENPDVYKNLKETATDIRDYGHEN